MIAFPLASLILVVNQCSLALARFKYTDKSCDAYSSILVKGSVEAYSAVTAAINALDLTPSPKRVDDMLLSCVGKSANEPVDDPILVSNFKGE